jgi:hypothetical protein
MGRSEAEFDSLPVRRRAELTYVRALCFQTHGLTAPILRLHRALAEPKTSEEELAEAYRDVRSLLRLPTREKWEAVTERPYPGNWQQLRDLWVELGLPTDRPVAAGQGDILSGRWAPRDVADVVFAAMARSQDRSGRGGVVSASEAGRLDPRHVAHPAHVLQTATAALDCIAAIRRAGRVLRGAKLLGQQVSSKREEVRLAREMLTVFEGQYLGPLVQAAEWRGIDAGVLHRFGQRPNQDNGADAEALTRRLIDLATVELDRLRLGPGGADGANSANTCRLFSGPVPENPDIRDLVVRLDSERNSGKSNNEIARAFTGETIGNDRKAQSLLAQIRYLKKNGRVTL